MLVPFVRNLKLGDKGKDVLMVKRALAVAPIPGSKPKKTYRKWGWAFTQSFGGQLKKDIERFQKDHGLKVDGEYGPETHKKLAKYFDSYGAKTMISLLPTTPVCVQAAMVAMNNRGLVHYSQSTRMMIVRYGIKPLAKLIDWFKRGKQLWEDCSSSSTGFYYIEGRPDPNDCGYNGLGYTGTLVVHGTRVSTPQPGDLGFYGSGWPYHHVVICVGIKNGVPMVVSHGSENGPLLLPYNYRGDFSHWRRYP
jgi:hypothetical protein